MLHDFLQKYRSDILALVEEKSVRLAGSLSSSEELRKGLPLFYEHLITFLQRPDHSEDKDIIVAAAGHGKELLRLHYSLSHVVHSYGAMCQAITELAQRKALDISSGEFKDLNLCLDIAIASAVSEFQFRSVKATEEKEVQHLGFLVHELRNALSSATIAHDMIKQGLVGIGGSTARVLEENLSRMRNIIDRSLSEVRMRADPEVYIEQFNLKNLVEQILITAQSDARKKRQVLKNDVSALIELSTDRQLLLSIIANLIQNGLKFSKDGGTISIKGRSSGTDIVIEIQDECGGIEQSMLKGLFKPFASGGFDQSGLGLGLTIVQRAVSLLRGTISVQNNPKVGCVFQVKIPSMFTPLPKNKSVSGESSVQPNGRNKPSS